MSVWYPSRSATRCGWDFESTAVYIPKHWIHSMIDEICLGVDLEALEPSSSGKAVIAPSWSGRSSASSMNCPDYIFLASFPGTGGKSSPIVTG